MATRIVIIGGGPTGVELAGTIAELAKDTLAGDFRHIDTQHARVLLIEGSDRILVQVEGDVPFRKLCFELHDELLHNLIDDFRRKRRERDDRVEAVAELGREQAG